MDALRARCGRAADAVVHSPMPFKLKYDCSSILYWLCACFIVLFSPARCERAADALRARYERAASALRGRAADALRARCGRAADALVHSPMPFKLKYDCSVFYTHYWLCVCFIVLFSPARCGRAADALLRRCGRAADALVHSPMPFKLKYDCSFIHTTGCVHAS